MSCQSVLITRLLQNLLMSDMLELVDDHQTQAYSDIIIRNAALPLDRLSLRAGLECNRPAMPRRSATVSRPQEWPGRSRSHQRAGSSSTGSKRTKQLNLSPHPPAPPPYPASRPASARHGFARPGPFAGQSHVFAAKRCKPSRRKFLLLPATAQAPRTNSGEKD